MKKSALIICNGEPPPRNLARLLAQKVDLVVAADGGADVALRFKIRPDVIIGDFDSVRPATLRRLSSSKIVHLADQDTTDLEKALGFLVSEEYERAVVIGATGKRLDFTLGNFVSTWKYATRLRLSFVGEDWWAVPVVNELQLRARIGTTVSVIPFGRCSDISLTGFKYPLKHATLGPGWTGISNVVKSIPAVVRVGKGNLLVVVLGRPVLDRQVLK